jgi:hypothetical protein
MKSFESFSSTPKHDPVESASQEAPQTSFEAMHAQQGELIAAAKMKFEGAVISSPLNPEQKEKLLAEIETLQQEANLADEFRDTRATPEENAYLWVQRRIGSRISRVLPELDRSKLEMLDIHFVDPGRSESDRQFTSVKADGDTWKISWGKQNEAN